MKDPHASEVKKINEVLEKYNISFRAKSIQYDRNHWVYYLIAPKESDYYIMMARGCLSIKDMLDMAWRMGVRPEIIDEINSELNEL